MYTCVCMYICTCSHTCSTPLAQIYVHILNLGTYLSSTSLTRLMGIARGVLAFILLFCMYNSSCYVEEDVVLLFVW